MLTSEEQRKTQHQFKHGRARTDEFEHAAFRSRTKDLVGFSGCFRFLPEFAVNSRFSRFLPPVSWYFRVFPNGFKADIRHITGSTIRCNRPGYTHDGAGALPFGQTLGWSLGCIPIFSVKSPRDLSYCAWLIAPCSKNVSNSFFCRR